MLYSLGYGRRKFIGTSSIGKSRISLFFRGGKVLSYSTQKGESSCFSSKLGFGERVARR